MILKTDTIRGKDGDNLVVTFERGYFGLSSGGMNFIVSDKASHRRLQHALHSEGRLSDLEKELKNTREALANVSVREAHFRQTLEVIATGTMNWAYIAKQTLEEHKP